MHPQGEVLPAPAPLDLHVEQNPLVRSGEQGDLGEDIDKLPGVRGALAVSPGEARQAPELCFHEDHGFGGIGVFCQIGKGGAKHGVKELADDLLPELVVEASLHIVVFLRSFPQFFGHCLLPPCVGF